VWRALNRARNRAQARNRARRVCNRAEKRRPRAEKGRKRPQARRAGKISAQTGGLVEGRGQSMCLQSTILSYLSMKLLRPPLCHGHPSATGLPLQSPLACRVRRGPPPPRASSTVRRPSEPAVRRLLLCSSAVSPTLRLQASGNLQFLSYPTPSFLQFINCDVVCACALLCCAYCLCSGLWCECVICIYFVLCFACALLVLLIPFKDDEDEILGANSFED